MLNDKYRMTKEIRMTNAESGTASFPDERGEDSAHGGFGIRHSFDMEISTFVN